MKSFSSVLLSCVLAICLCVSPLAAQTVREQEDLPAGVAASINVENAQANANADLPVAVDAKAAVLMDCASGTVLLEHNADTPLYPASVTKIMTILLVVEALDSGKIALTDTVTASSNAVSKGGSQIWLKEGEQMTVDELLRATVIGSANDAATALGEYVSGSEEAFVQAMNDRAKELGMKNTHFCNPTGLDDDVTDHLTTARDVALMSRALLGHEIVRKYSTVWMDSLRDGATELVNTNKLVRFYEGTTGLKTGTTSKAGCCVSASAEREGLHLIAVVMGSGSSKARFDTAKALLNYGFATYTTVVPPVDETLFHPVSVLGGEQNSVAVPVPELAPLLVKKGQESSVGITVEMDDSVEAPVLADQTLGTLTVTLAGETVRKLPLKPCGPVAKLSFFGMLQRLARALCTG